MKENLKNILMMVAIILVIVLIGGICYGYYQKANYKIESPIVTMEVQDMGTIKIELYPDVAPNTVKNFIALANNGFYNGLTFHRVVKDFMIQGGDPNGDGTGSATLSDIDSSIEEGSEEDKEYSIKGEFTANGVENYLKCERGVIAMARSDYSSLSSSLLEAGYNSGCSQFFIVTKTTSSLNGNYAAFGRVIEGMDVVDQIENVEIDTSEESSSSDKPVNPPVITSVTVDTKGVDYGIPETEEPFDYSSWMQQYYGLSY